MLQWFRRRAEGGRRAEELYGSVVTVARQPAFYVGVGVPDTPEGRFELIALHLFLALEGMKERNAVDTALSQRTIEAFVTDMDDCMREMGVGDMAVAKKVKRAAAAFYERANAYRRALAGVEAADLEASLERYVFAGDTTSRAGAVLLARYARGAATALSAQPFETLSANGEFGRLLENSRADVS